jgi:hypothetical protein
MKVSRSTQLSNAFLQNFFLILLPLPRLLRLYRPRELTPYSLTGDEWHVCRGGAAKKWGTARPTFLPFFAASGGGLPSSSFLPPTRGGFFLLPHDVFSFVAASGGGFFLLRSPLSTCVSGTEQTIGCAVPQTQVAAVGWSITGCIGHFNWVRVFARITASVVLVSHIGASSPKLHSTTCIYLTIGMT